MRCVAVRYTEPLMLAVQVWQGDDTLVEKTCVDAAEIATEADRRLELLPPIDRTEHSRSSAD